MRSASLSELKKELQQLSARELADLCVALAKYKKDNKEFLGYLLFEAHDKVAFVKEVNAEVDSLFADLNKNTNLYYAKKSLRKILRIINKYNKYMGDKSVAAGLLMYFCNKLKSSGIPIRRSQLIVNMYEQQLKKINTLIGSLHEDLQADFQRELELIALD